MARPAGAITALNVFYDIYDNALGGDGQQDLYYIIRTPKMHQDFETNKVPGQLPSFHIHRQVYLANSGEIDEYWQIGETSKMALSTVPHNFSTGGTTELEDAQIQNPTGTAMQRVPDERYCVARQAVYNNAATGDTHLYMVGFEAVNDVSYSGVGVEMLQRTANRLYAPDYPCSAWHVMCALQQTHEKILYENRPAFSIPVFGYITPAGGPV